MNSSEVWSITQAIIVSVGGAGIIIIGLSSWLGKVWANRIMETDRAKYARELELLRSKLQHENEQNM